VTPEGGLRITPEDVIARLWVRRYETSARSEIRRLIALLKLARGGGFYGLDETGELA
jgi:hypothetical protein